MTLRRVVVLSGLVLVVVGAAVAIRIEWLSGGTGSSAARGSGSDFVWRAPAVGGRHRAYVLRRDGARIEVLDEARARVVATRSLAGIGQVDVHGADGRDNTLTVDLSGGPIPVAGGVYWWAGSGGYNTLALRGSTGTERTFSSGPHSGRIVVGATNIHYAQIAPIIDSASAVNFTYVVPHGALSVSLTDGGAQAGCGDTMEIQVVFAESEFICNKTNVTIDGLGGTVRQGIALNEASTPTGLSSLLVEGGRRGNTIGVVVSPFNVATTVDSGTGNDDITVQTTGSGGSLVIDGQAGADTVAVGKAGSAQGVVSDLTVDSAALRVDDSADDVRQGFIINAQSLDAQALGSVASATISFSNLSSLEVDDASGSGTSVRSTPPGIVTTVVTSSASSSFDVEGTAHSGSLHLVDNANVAGTVGFGLVHPLAGPVSVSGTGLTSLLINDFYDSSGRTWTGTATGVSGLSPGAISWPAGSVRSSVVYEGTGSDTANIVPAAQTTFMIRGGRPTHAPGDKLVVNLAGVHGRRFATTGGSGSWTFTNRASVHFSQIESVSSTGTGYLLAAANGNVFAAGGASTRGSLATTLSNPVVGIAATSDGGGYWEATRNGTVRAFGDAASFGDLPSMHVNVTNIVAIAPTTDGRGYWMIGSDGGEFAFGDAGYHGSLPGLGIHVNNIVGMVAAPSGKGYLLVGSDGGVFAFGSGVRFFGSLPGLHITVHNVVAILSSPNDTGYDLVGSDGGVFSFGTGVHFFGSLPGQGIAVSDIVGLALTPDTLGYWLAGANGSVYAFGNGQSFAAPPGIATSLPIAAIAGT